MLRDPKTNKPIVVFIIYRKGIKLLNFSSVGFIKLSNIREEEKLLNNFGDQSLSENELNLIRWRRQGREENSPPNKSKMRNKKA